MHQQRIVRLQNELQQAGLDVAILVPGPNLYYITGLSMHLSERVTAAFVPSDGTPLLVVPNLEKPQAESHNKIEAELILYRDEDGPVNAIGQAISALRLQRAKVGVEHLNMRVLEQDLIKNAAPHAQFSKLDELITMLRVIKDEDEISKMRLAIRLTEQILQKTLSQIKEGMTEAEAALIYQYEALKAGSGTMSFTPIVASGPNGGSPHVIPGSRKLQQGDMVTIDAGVFADHYPGDITRNAAIGTLDPELEKIHRIVEAANEAGRAAAKPGVPCQDVDRAARNVIEDAGYGEYFIHRTGHGLGLEIHEPPYIIEGNSQELQPGMTFTIEPGIYIPGIGGARVEDDMLITPDGAESLTTLSRALFRI